MLHPSQPMLPCLPLDTEYLSKKLKLSSRGATKTKMRIHLFLLSHA